MKIGIISDIHCHEEGKPAKQGGYYFPSMSSTPISQNPFVALKKIIADERIELDYILSPGDYSHQIDEKGFISAWDQLKLLVQSTNSKRLIGTIGNHDVASRSGGNAFEVIQKMDYEFPVFQNPERFDYQSKLLNDTFYTIDDNDHDTHFFILNSCYDHWTKVEASRGAIDMDKLNLLKKEIVESKRGKKILLVHHHPQVHETGILDTEDLIKGAQELMKVVEDIDLIIHGHKHDFCFTRNVVYPKNLNIFSSGSFSCFKTSLRTGAQNCFHIVEFQNEEIDNCHNSGRILTYLYDPAIGWSYVKGLNEGFGCILSDHRIEKDLNDMFLKHSRGFIHWEEIIKIHKHMEFIPRTVRLEILQRLEERNEIVRVNFDSFTLAIGDIILR